MEAAAARGVAECRCNMEVVLDDVVLVPDKVVEQPCSQLLNLLARSEGTT